MDIRRPTPLLGGLSPQAFMRRHWQKKPLLIRQALPGIVPPLDAAALFALAARDDVESRLVTREGARWRLKRGPLPRRSLPPLARPGWTLLVQGVDLHADAAHALLQRFRFVPDARLDDLMVSYASDAGGVGPHVDSYDVFLLQLQGRRRWRVGPPSDAALLPDMPLKILADFQPDREWLLEPGDMLYLPPHWAHEGVAEGGGCITGSIGFRAAGAGELAVAVLQRMLDAAEAEEGAAYRDPALPAAVSPARVPASLTQFAARALQRMLAEPGAVDCALGEVLSEPKPLVVFDPGVPLRRRCGVRLDRRTRMLYDRARIYINGESFVAGGRDALLMRRLADRRRLPPRDVAALGEDAAAVLAGWIEAGWAHGDDETAGAKTHRSDP